VILDRLALALLAAVALVPATLAAQDGMGCTRSAFAPLRGITGRWDVSATERLAPDRYQETGGTALFELVFDCTIREARSGIRGENDYGVAAMISVPTDEEVQYLHLDSEHGSFMVSVGGWQGDTLVVDWARDMGNRTLRLQRRILLALPDSVVATYLLRPSDESPWEVVWRGLYRRPSP